MCNSFLVCGKRIWIIKNSEKPQYKMASKYVPPHMRNSGTAQPSGSQRNNRRYAPRYQPEPEPVKEPEPVLDTSDKSFPQLGNGAMISNKWVGTKSFASLATEWKEADETAQLSSNVDSYSEFRLPRFTNTHRYVEAEEQFHEEDEAKPPSEETEDNGWTEVKTKVRKVHRKKTIEEQIAEEEEEERRKKAESCWNEDGEETTTVWNS